MSEKYNTITTWSGPDRGCVSMAAGKRFLKSRPATGTATKPVDLPFPDRMRNDPADCPCVITFGNKELGANGTTSGAFGRVVRLADEASAALHRVFV